MTLEPYLRLAAFGTGAAELMLRQTGRRGQTVLVQFYDASDNGCGIISGLKHHCWRFEGVADQRKNK